MNVRKDHLGRTVGACALLAISMFASPASANLLTNGSFEDGTFNPLFNDTVSLLAGSTQMTGWTVTVDSLSWIGASNPFGLSAPDGSKLLDLTDYRDRKPYAGVSQSFSTSIGATYLLTFKLGSSAQYGQPVTLAASAGDTQLTFTSTGVGNNLWEAKSMSFTATGTSTTLNLVGFAGQQNISLDDVSVVLTADAPVMTPVPEPSSAALLALGLSGLGVFSARRRRRT